MNKITRVEMLKKVLETDSYGWVELYEPLLHEIDFIEQKINDYRDLPFTVHSEKYGYEIESAECKIYFKLVTKYNSLMAQLNGAYRSLLPYLERELEYEREKEE